MTDKNYGTWSEFSQEGLDEMEQAHLDAHCESVMMEQEEAQAKADGFCIHCGEDLDKCTGYKCWIR